MNLSVSFELASRLLALSGYLSLLFTGELNLPFMVVPVIGLGLSLFQVLTGQRWILPRKVWNGFTVLAFLFFLADLEWITGSLLMSSTHFLILLMVNKLFNLELPQDHLHLYIISFLELLAASALTVNFSYALTFLIFLFVGVWALMLYHLTIEQKARLSLLNRQPGSSRQAPASQAGADNPPDRTLTDRIITLPFFLSTNGLALGAFILTLLIFFFIPRMSIGLLHEKKESLIRLSGFSEQVDLGVLGAIKLDPTIVMRIELPGGNRLQSQPYWRGGAYDYYNGTSWKNSFGKGRSMPKDFNGLFLIRPTARIEKALRQEILLEPLDTAVMFAASQPAAIEGSRLFQLNVNAMDAIYLNFLPASKLQYTAYSESPDIVREDRRLERWDYSQAIRSAYLQLPEKTERIGELAAEVAHRAPTIYEKVLLVENYLQNNFRYSLHVNPPPEGMPPIDDFLFHQKTGYCEQYATAMVLMLRQLGIPARLVTGFLAGEWNDFGNYYLVRQQDAHSWVEVYFPHSGWIKFDPTPSAGPGDHIAVLGTVSKYLDSLRLKWDRYIVRFSFRDQMNLVKDVKMRTNSVRVTANWWISQVGIVLDSIEESVLSNRKLVVSACAVGLMILAWLMRRKKGWSGFKFIRKERSRKTHAVWFYAKLLEILASYGFHKAPNKTPKEFALEIRSRGEAIYLPVFEITLVYYRLRYGNLRLSADDERRVEALLTTILHETEKKPA
jgi:transglutaminase-like putative cysteine protease